MFDQLISMWAFLAIGLAAFGLGSPLARALRLDDDVLTGTVWSMALGLIVGGLGLAGLGLVGGLYAPLIGVLSLVACFMGVVEIISGLARRHEARLNARLSPRTILGATRPAWPPGLSEPHPSAPAATPAADEPPPWTPPPAWLSRGMLALALVAAVGALIAALAPPIAGDALCYHLDLPKTFLLQHSIRFLPDSDGSTYPLLTEIWYLWALALDGPMAAQLVHWGLGILLALATVVLATDMVGRRWAWIAGAAVLLIPGVQNQMTAPLNDLALAAMTTLTLAAWCRAVLADAGRRWFVAAGLAAGGALSIKYTALLFLTPLAATAAWTLFRQSRRRAIVQGAAIVAVVAVSVSGLWYLRAAWYRGNPLYPFTLPAVASRAVQGGMFGLPSNADETRRRGEEERYASSPRPRVSASPRPRLPVSALLDRPAVAPGEKLPLGHSPVRFVSGVWEVTMHPERFGGRSHQLGVLLLAALPGLATARRLRGLGTLLGVGLVYWVLWCLMRQNVRFLLPIVPLGAVGVAWCWIEMRRFPWAPRLAAGLTFALILAASSGLALARCQERAAVALGFCSRAAYLEENEPTWRAAAALNQTMAPGDHLLSEDVRAYYFNCRVTRDIVYRRRVPYDRQLTQPAQLSRLLRKAGFTHLLLVENLNGRGIVFDSTLSRLADAQWKTPAGQSLMKLADYRFQDSDGALRHYRLVRLGE